jgi:hypothetical protein
MRTLRIIAVAVAGLCLVVIAGYRLAGAADTPSLGGPIVVGPPSTASITPAARFGEPARPSPAQAPSSPSVTRTPPSTAAPVRPPPVQVAGDADDDADGD